MVKIEYITEERGWENTHEEVVGIKIEDRSFDKKFFNEGLFVDKNNDILEINIPPRIDGDIRVQSVGRSYDLKNVYKSQLEDSIIEIKEDKIIVDFNSL